jgi:hypothetical protein
MDWMGLQVPLLLVLPYESASLMLFASGMRGRLRLTGMEQYYVWFFVTFMFLRPLIELISANQEKSKTNNRDLFVTMILTIKHYRI